MMYDEYDLFIPVSPKNTQKPVKKILAEVRAEIVRFFGGLTESVQSNKGSWKLGPVTVKDDIQIWHVLSDKGISGERFLKKIRKRLEQDLKQDQVLVIRHRVHRI